MRSGKYAFWCPVALIRPSRSACSNSQIRYPYGLITMLPRTGPRSTSSARKTTSLYQAEKSSLCGVPLCSSRAMSIRLPSRLALLLDADQVARGITEGTVANPVRLLGRLLDDLGVAGLQPLEEAVEVLGGQEDAGVAALGHHLGDGAALIVGDAAARRRGRLQDDGRAGLVGGADGDPAHPPVSDVVADLEAEGVAIEGQGGVRVVMREEGHLNGDVHGGHASCRSVAGASRFLIGLVTCFATHDGIPAVARASWRR